MGVQLRVFALAHRLLESVRQRAHEIEQVHLLGGALHGGFFDLALAEADVEIHGSGEQIRILQDYAEVAAKVV